MRIAAIAAVVALLTVATPGVRAQEPPADTQSARALGDAGLKLYQQKKYAEAFKRLSMASELVQAPTIRLYMARCKRELGELIAAREHYLTVTQQKLPADASDLFKEARADAERELTEVVARIPTLNVNVKPADAKPTITVDGAAFAGSGQLDPGDHEVVVEAKGYQTAKRKVTLPEGEKQLVFVELVPVPQDGQEPAEPVVEGGEGSLVPAFIAFGLGAAGLGVGIGFGLVAKGELDDIEERCVDDHCLVEDETAADDARVLAHVSTVGFVVGGVGVAAGIALAIWRPGGDESTALYVSPTSISFRGSF